MRGGIYFVRPLSERRRHTFRQRGVEAYLLNLISGHMIAPYPRTLFYNHIYFLWTGDAAAQVESL